MQEMDKEIQNIHVMLEEEGTADQNFVDADNTSDTHSVLLRQLDKNLAHGFRFYFVEAYQTPAFLPSSK